MGAAPPLATSLPKSVPDVRFMGKMGPHEMCLRQVMWVLVRFGFVGMSAALEDASPSRTMTVQNFLSQPSRATALQKLNYLASRNLAATSRILLHAANAGIPLYRFSSRLIPLLGHEATADHAFFLYLGKDFQEVGDIVRRHHMRVSFHPDHFVVLSAEKGEVRQASLGALEGHVQMLRAMGLQDASRLVVHVGGAYGDKPSSIERFKAAVAALPEDVAQLLAVENDDRTFSAKDVLALSESGPRPLPVVIDTLHHLCNPGGLGLADALSRAFSTWDGLDEPPKVHLSSPRSDENTRAHADFVRPGDGLQLLEAAREIGRDFDVMIEAKQKDLALLRLLDELSTVERVQRIAGGVIDYRP